MAGRPAGLPKTGGRKKGSINKKSRELKEIAEDLGVDPFEVLLHFAKGDYKALGYAETVTKYVQGGESYEEPTISPELRQKSAKDACEYLHPKLKSIELKGSAANPLEVFLRMTKEERDARRYEYEQRLGISRESK